MAIVTTVTLEVFGSNLYRVRIYTDPPPEVSSVMTEGTFLTTLHDLYSSYAYQTTPYSTYIGLSDFDGTTPCLVGEFTGDLSEYVADEWEVLGGNGLTFPDSSMLGASAGSIPYNYTPPLTDGTLFARILPGNQFLEVYYSDPPTGGQMTYLMWNFGLLTYPDFNYISSSSESGNYTFFDLVAIGPFPPGQKFIAFAQIQDAIGQWSNEVQSPIVTLQGSSSSVFGLGLGLALGTP